MRATHRSNTRANCSFLTILVGKSYDSFGRFITRMQYFVNQKRDIGMLGASMRTRRLHHVRVRLSMSRESR